MKRIAVALIGLLVAVGVFACNASAQESAGSEEADKLHTQVVELFHEKKFKEALPLAKRAVELREKTLGLSNEKTLASLKNLAAVYSEMKKTGDAVAVREKVLEAEESLYGVLSIKLSDNLSKLGWANVHNRDYNNAEKAFRRNLQVKETAWGTESKELLPALNDLAL
ncbi:MAG: tetratricopeptide repeat protein, partial [Acidobacteriota bacterium]